MTETARKLAAWEDLLRMADDGRTYEILGGEIQALPRPLPAHRLAQSLLSGELSPPFQRGRGGPGGWWLVIEPDIRLAPSEIVAPDVAGWRKERMPIFPRTRPIDTTPDWICEILSPSTSDVTVW
jgi:Uma2 family endonuclease